jgi:mannose-6-phosphate isomerase-like protein (cupin superfamily)
MASSNFLKTINHIKLVTVIVGLLLLSYKTYSQNYLHKIKEINPPANFDNVYQVQLFSDSLSTVFCIWIKKEVKLHQHNHHTEQVFVIEGSAEMKLGNQDIKLEPGMLINIPIKTPHKVKVNSIEPLKIISIQSPIFDGSDRIILE